MWDLNTIVRMNDEAQRRVDAIREYEVRECQANDQQTFVAVGLACPLNREDEQAA